MLSSEEPHYRLNLAEGFLFEAREDINLNRWRSCVDNSPLAVENAAKVALALLGPVGRTHARAIRWYSEVNACARFNPPRRPITRRNARRSSAPIVVLASPLTDCSKQERGFLIHLPAFRQTASRHSVRRRARRAARSAAIRASIAAFAMTISAARSRACVVAQSGHKTPCPKNCARTRGKCNHARSNQ